MAQAISRGKLTRADMQRRQDAAGRVQAITRGRASRKSVSEKKEKLDFVAGFGSSAIVGTIVGSLADKYGRKRNNRNV